MKTRIKDLRLENNMSTEELALRLNITSRTIQRYESGSIVPPAEKLKKISNIFDCSIDYLLYVTDVKPINTLSIETPNGIKSNQSNIVIDYETKNIFINRLKDKMIDEEINKNFLVQKLAINKDELNKYLSGEKFPDVVMLKKIAKILNTTMDYLVGLSNKSNYDEIEIMEDWVQFKEDAKNKDISPEAIRNFLKSVKSDNK